jgi:hypothetical protein
MVTVKLDTQFVYVGHIDNFTSQSNHKLLNRPGVMVRPWWLLGANDANKAALLYLISPVN